MEQNLVVDEKEISITDIYNTYIDKQVTSTIQNFRDSELQDEDYEDAIDKEEENSSGLSYGALALSVTVVNFATNATRTEVYKDNKVSKVRWVAILDSSVCEDCEELNDTIFDADDAEIPPEHWNCRCILEPVEDDEDSEESE